MPKRRRIPSYRLHKPSGQAVVRLSGRMHYLGEFGSTDSRREYDRLITQWLNWTDVGARDLTVSQVTVHFWRHAKEKYGKTGKGPYGAAVNWRPLLRMLRKYFGKRKAIDFGPKSAKTLIPAMIVLGWSRKYINRNLSRIKQIFEWAASEEHIHHEVALKLSTLKGIYYGETEARETQPVEPVSDAIVDKTLPHLSEKVADMVRFQRLTGCRPGEVCIIRPCDVSKQNPVWVYTPPAHKTRRFEKNRRIYIGPRAQAILARYMLKPAEMWCFESRPGRHYTTDSYRRAIQRNCTTNGIEQWAPNQLRHTAGTEVRAEFGAEHAQAILGHSNLSTTEIYAERTEARAIEAAKRLG